MPFLSKNLCKTNNLIQYYLHNKPSLGTMIDIEKQRVDNSQRFIIEHHNPDNIEEDERAFLTHMRLGFIRKAYSILADKFLLTVFLCILSRNNKGFATFQLQNAALAWVCLVIEVVTMIALFKVPSLGRQAPLKYVLLGLLTVTEAYGVSFLTVFFSGNVVLLAALATTAAVVTLTIYAMTTKTDFTDSRGNLCVIVAVLSTLILVNFFIQSSIIQLFFSAAFAVLFGIYLVYDAQRIVEEKSEELQENDYIWGALMLSISFVGLFSNILNILAEAHRDRYRR